MSKTAYGVLCYKIPRAEEASEIPGVVAELVRILQSVGGELTTLEEVQRQYIQDYTGEAEHLEEAP